MVRPIKEVVTNTKRSYKGKKVTCAWLLHTYRQQLHSYLAHVIAQRQEGQEGGNDDTSTRQRRRNRIEQTKTADVDRQK
jgi:hypothetical protein